MDKTQQNSKCRLCGDRDETIDHLISECYELAQKEYKTRHDRAVKVIRWELCKKLKFDPSTKWHMHKLESVQENQTLKILCDLEIKTGHKIPTRRQDPVIVNKKEKQPNSELYRSGRPLSENQRKRKEIRVLRPCQRNETKTMRTVMVIPIVIGAFRTIPRRLIRGLDELEIGGRVETIQITALLRSTRILKRVLETYCHSDSSERLSTNASVKDS